MNLSFNAFAIKSQSLTSLHKPSGKAKGQKYPRHPKEGKRITLKLRTSVNWHRKISGKTNLKMGEVILRIHNQYELASRIYGWPCELGKTWHPQKTWTKVITGTSQELPQMAHTDKQIKRHWIVINQEREN